MSITEDEIRQSMHDFGVPRESKAEKTAQYVQSLMQRNGVLRRCTTTAATVHNAGRGSCCAPFYTATSKSAPRMSLTRITFTAMNVAKVSWTTGRPCSSAIARGVYLHCSSDKPKTKPAMMRALTSSRHSSLEHFGRLRKADCCACLPGKAGGQSCMPMTVCRLCTCWHVARASHVSSSVLKCVVDRLSLQCKVILLW